MYVNTLDEMIIDVEKQNLMLGMFRKMYIKYSESLGKKYGNYLALFVHGIHVNINFALNYD